MSKFREDCPGCGRICTLTLVKKDDRYYLKGSSCNSGRHNAIEIWDFLNEDNLSIEDIKKKEEKKNLFPSFFKLIFKK